MSYQWKITEVAQLRRLVLTGRSASEIGVIMNRSRCSIIGKCYRDDIALALSPCWSARKPVAA